MLYSLFYLLVYEMGQSAFATDGYSAGARALSLPGPELSLAFSLNSLNYAQVSKQQKGCNICSCILRVPVQGLRPSDITGRKHCMVIILEGFQTHHV